MSRLGIAIGIGVVGGFLGALLALFIIPIPVENKELVTYMIGQLSGLASGIVSYHYASTALGSKATDNTGAAFRAIEAAVNATPGERAP